MPKKYVFKAGSIVAHPAADFEITASDNRSHQLYDKKSCAVLKSYNYIT